METGRHFAYNVTRNLLLSERVWCAAESLGPEELLELVMNGPGLDRHSGVWVGQVPGWSDLPRLLAFDFAYLDERQKIVQFGSAGPGAGFPPVGEGVAGALILANRRLAETGAVAGDEMRICGEAELAALVKAGLPAPMETAHAALRQVPIASPIPFQVSRYPEFIFEPFAGSLVFLPQAEAPPPQSTEYFLPQTAAENATAAEPPDVERAKPLESPMETEGKRAKAAVRLRKRSKSKPALPQEDSHFYTPKPIRFFDPGRIADKQESEKAYKTQQIPPRQSAQLSPELRDAIFQIDEQLRHEKQDLEQGEKKKTQAKERKRTSGKKAPAKTAELESIDILQPSGEELAEPVASSEPMAAAGTAEPELAAEPIPATEPLAEAGSEVATEPELAAEPEIIEKFSEEPVLPSDAVEFPAFSMLAAAAPEVENKEAAEMPFRAFDPLKETISPPESISPVEEILLQDETPASAPREIVSAVFADEPLSPAPVKESISHEVHEITEPERPRKVTRPAKEKLTLGERLQRWIGGEGSLSGNRRKSERVALPGMVAFYWTGGAPKPHEIVNISKNGFYLRTKDLWLPDTLVRMTLHRPHDGQGRGEDSISILARVVRIDEEGVGHEFVTSDALRHVRSRDVLPEHGTNAKELERFLGNKS